MIKHMAENLNPNQNPQPVQRSGQNPPSVPAPHQTVSGPASQSASPPAAKPPEPNLGEVFKPFGSPKIILAILAIALLAAALGYYYFRSLRQPPKGEEAAPTISLAASPIPGATPPQLPKVQEEDKKVTLREFFKKASPVNFKELFLETLPAAAAESYLRYSSADSAEAKQGAARGFYILLNNPAAPNSDPQFVPFVKDIHAQLEKEIGKPLF